MIVKIVTPEPLVSGGISAKCDVQYQSHVLEGAVDVASGTVEDKMRGAPSGWIRGSGSDVAGEFSDRPAPYLQCRFGPLGRVCGERMC